MRHTLLLALPLLLAGHGALADEPVAVRAGSHPNFGRVVFDWPATVGYSVAREGDRASAPYKVDLRTSATAELELELHDATVSGIVVDASGEPVPEASVFARSSDRSFAFEEQQAVTDSSGRWTLGPFSGTEYRVNATWPDAEVNRREVGRDGVAVKPGERNVRIVLEAAATPGTNPGGWSPSPSSSPSWPAG